MKITDWWGEVLTTTFSSLELTFSFKEKEESTLKFVVGVTKVVQEVLSI